MSNIKSAIMLDSQHFADRQKSSSNSRDSNHLFSGRDPTSPSHRRTGSSSLSVSGTGPSGKLDPIIYSDIQEIIPLVETLIKRNPSSSFTRRGSINYTKTPSKLLGKKTSDPKGRSVSRSIPGKKRGDYGNKEQGKGGISSQDEGADNYSVFSSKALVAERDKEVLVTLREQVADLERKLFEKDELLKSSEILKNQLTAIHVELDELKHQASEKDSIIKSVKLKLSDAKIKLADKQAALEKTQWEAMTSNKKVEKLQQDLDSVEGGISSFMHWFEGLTLNDAAIPDEGYDVAPSYMDDLLPLDDLDMVNIEKAREVYVSAVAAAKAIQNEESIASAASARRHLQSLVLGES